VLAAVELARRLALAAVPERQLLTRPAEVATYLALRFRQSDQEVMGALLLDDLPAFDRRALHALAGAMDTERLQLVATQKVCAAGRRGDPADGERTGRWPPARAARPPRAVRWRCRPSVRTRTTMSAAPVFRWGGRDR
jgi:hypothetical protein